MCEMTESSKEFISVSRETEDQEADPGAFKFSKTSGRQIMTPCNIAEDRTVEGVGSDICGIR